jgi:hypothetical protein
MAKVALAVLVGMGVLASVLVWEVVAAVSVLVRVLEAVLDKL